MIKLILYLFLCFPAFEMQGQVKTDPAHTKEYYLHKSQEQKKTAWIMLGTGLGIAAVGGLVQLSHANPNDFNFDFTGVYIAIAGGVVSALSIPLFIGSSNNKRKAASIAIHTKSVLLPGYNCITASVQPAVTINISL